MKTFLLATVAFAALGLPTAFAADLAAKPTTKAPVPAAEPIPTWAGFYLGGMGGYATANDAGVISPKGGFVGGTAGYNWQTGAWVFGLETDAAWADINDSASRLGITLASKTEATGTVRGRIGYTFNTVLLYGTGGYAWADNKITLSGRRSSFSDSQFLSGWTAGGGVEVLFAPKWSIKAEYLYKSFDGKSYFSGALPTGHLNLNTVQGGINYHF